MVVGPVNLLEQINYIETIEQEVMQLDKSQTIVTRLQLPENLQTLKVSPREVEVNITVDKFTESTIKIPIVNSVKKYKIKTYPDHVILTYLVTLDNYKRVNEEMFTASVNYVENDTLNKLKVNLLHKPSFVKVTKIDPEEVEFLLLKQ